MAQTYRVDSSDVRTLLRVASQVAAAKDEPRRWRQVLLGSLRELLRADAGLTLEIECDGEPTLGRVAKFHDFGITGRERRAGLLRELNEPVIRDPLLTALLKRLCESRHTTVTFARSDVVRDDVWKKNAIVARRRATVGFDDAVASLTKMTSPARVMGLLFLRSSGGGHPFGQRERTLLGLFHAELSWIYSAEFKSRPEHAASLSPRLEETLMHLAAGRDERETAKAMELSPHTVHDYVKILYAHFGVSSRADLTARWTRREAGKEPAGKRK
jgi:DNA-binding CsgD family transcriptional regulator